MNPAGSAEARNVPPGADCFSLIQSDDPRIQSCVLCVGLQEVWGNLRPEQSFKGLLCLLLKADLWKASLNSAESKARWSSKALLSVPAEQCEQETSSQEAL